MKIILIAALTRGKVIGKEGSIPWQIKEDMDFFRTKTSNKSIIMGRKTFESIGRPLPNRLNIVMTGSEEKIRGVIKVNNKEDALQEAKKFSSEIFVIGGQNIYKTFFEEACEMYLTEIDSEIEGDTFFPEWNKSEWIELSREPKKDLSQELNYEFVRYARNLNA